MGDKRERVNIAGEVTDDGAGKESKNSFGWALLQMLLAEVLQSLCKKPQNVARISSFREINDASLAEIHPDTQH